MKSSKSCRSKRILLLVFMLILAFLLQLTAITTASADDNIYVQDNANVLSKTTRTSIYELNKKIESTTAHAQLLVVTINKLPAGESIEQYSMKIAEKYKPGDGKKDTGLVYVLDTSEHKDRLEVGYGLEGTIPDAQAAEIIDAAHDSYKNDDWDTGVSKVMTGVKDSINGEFKSDENNDTDDSSKYHNEAIAAAIIIALLLGALVIIESTSDDSGSSGYGGSSYSGFDSSSSFSSGSSFGGGSFGGGGASGSW